MSSRRNKLLVFTLVGMFAIAPLAMAQQSGTGTGSGTGQQMDRPGAGSSSTSPSTTGTQSQMGTMGMQDAIHATVADVNKQRKTVKLRTQDGDSVELKVSDRLLTTLNEGDSVQVSIHKAEGKMGGTGAQPSRPGSGTDTDTGTGGTRPGQSR